MRSYSEKAVSKLKTIMFLFIAMTMTTSVFASTVESLPWDAPGQRIESWLTGSVAKMVAIILIALSGILFANGEHGSAFRRMMGIVFGVSISVGAASIYSSLGFSGAVI